MKSQNQQELIDQFLQNELKGQELTDFLEKLKSDSNLAQEVELQKLLARGIQDQGNQELRERLKHIHQDVKNSKSSSKKSIGRFRKTRLVATFAAMGILLMIAFNFWNSSLTNDDLFVEFYQPFQVKLVSRDEMSGNLESRVEATYKAGDYKNVVKLLIELREKKENDSRVLLGLGNAYLNLGNYQNAEESFNEIIKNKDELYLDQAKWFLALTYLKSGKMEKCKGLLRQLTNEETTDFYEEAKALLTKVKE